jgi:hypothetical protein
MALRSTLPCEWLRAWRNWNSEHLGHVTAYGISLQALNGSRAGIGRITTVGNFFEPADSGEIALIFPVTEYVSEAPHLDEHGHLLSEPWPDPELVLVDLVAVKLDTPGHWQRRGAPAVMLGRDHLEAAACSGEPVNVFRSAIDWLLVNRTGLRSAFVNLNRLEAQSLEHGRDLHDWLHKPDNGLPAVHVPAAQRAAA